MKSRLLLGLVAIPLAATAAVAAPPAKFLTDAVGTDNAEVAAGQLAQQRGASPGVKDFGAKLVADHSAHKAKVLDVARQMHVRVDPGFVPPPERAEGAKLKRLNGRAFDREFAMHMTMGHKKAIAEFEQQAKGRDPTAGLARDTLPTLHEHLRIAQNLG